MDSVEKKLKIYFTIINGNFFFYFAEFCLRSVIAYIFFNHIYKSRDYNEHNFNRNSILVHVCVCFLVKDKKDSRNQNKNHYHHHHHRYYHSRFGRLAMK